MLHRGLRELLERLFDAALSCLVRGANSWGNDALRDAYLGSLASKGVLMPKQCRMQMLGSERLRWWQRDGAFFSNCVLCL